MYDQDKFFIENDFGRYSIGNTTDGLKSNPDGSLTITIQKDRPTDTSNWLPESDYAALWPGAFPAGRLLPAAGREADAIKAPHCERRIIMKRTSTIAAFALSLAVGWALGFPTAVAQPASMRGARLHSINEENAKAI
jgi:hypothetical protein